MTHLANDWWDALGHNVNPGSYNAALELAAEWGCHDGDRMKISMVLDVVCRELRHDNPDRAFKYIESMVGRTNQTAVYRLLAALVAPRDSDRVADLLDLAEELAR